MRGDDAPRCFHDIAGGDDTIVAEWRCDTVAVKGLVYLSSNVSDELRRSYVEGRMLISADMAADRRFSPRALAGFARAEVGARISVPLSRSGIVHAILAADSKVPRSWSETEVGLVREVADRMWTVMERARAEIALKEREQHQAAILASSTRRPAPTR